MMQLKDYQRNTLDAFEDALNDVYKMTVRKVRNGKVSSDWCSMRWSVSRFGDHSDRKLLRNSHKS